MKKRRRPARPPVTEPRNLHPAALRGDLERVRSELAAGVDANQPNHFGSLPLESAAANGHEAVVRLLLAAGAKVDGASFCSEQVDRQTYKVQRTALVSAALRRHEAVAMLLVKHGADVNAEDGFSGTTALVEAATAGFERLVAALLARGARVDARNGYCNLGVLKAAARGGNAQVVRMLLAHSARADPEALHEACRMGHVEIVEVLLEAGCDARAAKAPCAAASGGHVLLLERFLDRHRYSESELEDMLGSASGMATLRLLLDRCTYRKAALGRALVTNANSGCAEEVRLLLARGAPVDGRDKYGWTALMCAAYHGQLATVRILVEHGADPGLKESEGNTALAFARQQGRQAVVELLSGKRA